MKISYNWLKNYIETDIELQELEHILTDIGLEVEGVENYQSVEGGLEGLVIGKVLTCEKHPGADKLSKTTVDVGSGEPLPIVCGAPNVAAGQTVVVATVGTTLYSDEGSFKIKKSKIRGEASEGMICAEDELGLGESHDGIMVLPNELEAGLVASEHFNVENDIIFEIGLTPNRIDAASHYGVARDVAAYLVNNNKSAKLNMPSVEEFKTDNNNNVIDIEIENKEACSRYTGVTISNIEVKESPEWLKNRINAIGLKPINNVVDVTNYVLHELGHPLHAFDADKITGKKVVVKPLSAKTKFTTLDEEERELSSEDLMICNTEEGMCIAGVFGGLHSGVSNETKNIFLESAYFNPVWVRKTARRHILNTDSSFRFERGADINITVTALKRAAMLIKELAGGEISSDVIDIYPTPVENNQVNVTFKNIQRLIGKHIEENLIKSILISLDIIIKEETEEGLLLEIPSYRVDVTREADVIEEILRIYGYNNVEISNKVNSTLTYSDKPEKENLVNTVSDMLSNNGFNEIMCNSLTKAAYFENSNVFNAENTVQIFNPLSNDLSGMRQSLLFGGLESVSHNINRQNADLKLYEFGKIYSFDKEKGTENPLKAYHEEERYSIFVCGQKAETNWNTPGQESSFYELKSYTDRVLQRLGFNLNKFTFEYVNNDVYAEGMVYKLNGNTVAELGILNRKLTKQFEIKVPVYFADIHWTWIMKQVKKHKVLYTEISKFPEVRRDLALLIDSNVNFKQIQEIAFKAEKKLLKRINLFDVYEGDKLPEGKKSYAVAFYLQDETKTLNDKTIDKTMKRFIATFERELGAQLR